MQLFRDQEVFIVGGGESIKDFDWKLLYDKNVIACNVAFIWLPKAKVITFWDGNIWRKFRKELLMHDAWKVTIKDNAIHDNKVLLVDPKINGNVNDTGHLSIEIALQMGASKVYLLGYDGHGGNYHTLYRAFQWSNRDVFFNDKFERYADKEVYNLNHDSGIRCLKFAELWKK